MSRLAQWLILCVLWVCVAPSGEALAQAVKTPLPPDKAVIEIEGFSFPSQIAGFARTTRTDYGPPGVDFSVRYGLSEETWADIYVYDTGPDQFSGATLSLARQEVEAALDAVRALVKQGRYQNSKVRNRWISGSFAAARVTIVQGGREHDSFVFVTVHDGMFVKIRLSTSSATARNRLRSVSWRIIAARSKRHPLDAPASACRRRFETGFASVH